MYIESELCEISVNFEYRISSQKIKNALISVEMICYGSSVWHPYFQMSYYYTSAYTQENVVIKSNTFNSKNSEIQQMSKM